mmetsp:Transcript_13758/g.23883  ORF Transcript_13758/g.23883 Transcript_13758/m.23883 type:complete len:108 (+) Transcript_13758:971-1294(+)
MLYFTSVKVSISRLGFVIEASQNVKCEASQNVKASTRFPRSRFAVETWWHKGLSIRRDRGGHTSISLDKSVKKSSFVRPSSPGNRTTKHISVLAPSGSGCLRGMPSH